MEKIKITFSDVWFELTIEQREYLKNYINEQRLLAVKEYKNSKNNSTNISDCECFPENCNGSCKTYEGF